MSRLIWLCVLLSLLLNPSYSQAQDDVISIDFEPIGTFTSGWFAYDEIRGWFAVRDDDSRLYVIDEDSEIIFDFLPENDDPDTPLLFLDAAFSDDALVSIYSWGDSYRIYFHFNLRREPIQETFIINSADRPAYVWFECDENALGCQLWAEVDSLSADQPDYLITLPRIVPAKEGETDLMFDDVYALDDAPSADETAVVRLGRVLPPYEVTSTLDGVVKLWDVTTGEILQQVNHGAGIPAVFGNINRPPTHLVWRDNPNQTLYLMDWETGENRVISELNGMYIQWLFLAPSADVIYGVNIDGQPNIVQWDTATGDFVHVGNYRDCSRPQPDRAYLSQDGTRLIIGCDTGIDIWQLEAD